MTTKEKTSFRNILLLQHDQLSTETQLFKGACPQSDLLVMIEPASYLLEAKHHKKKVLLILAAMRLFAQKLTEQGWSVQYFALNKKNPVCANFEKNILSKLLKQTTFEQLHLLEANCYKKQKFYESLFDSKNTYFFENDFFLCPKEEFNSWAEGRRELTMEYFYRLMRKKLKILMSGSVPEGGKWNYDKDNRQSPPESLEYIKPFEPEYTHAEQLVLNEVTKIIEQHFSDYYGSLEGFKFPITSSQACQSLTYFCEQKLSNFGRYQDIMMQDNPWLYHAHISFPLNLGLISVQKCLQQALQMYEKHQVSLSSIEGFVRQIIGWREFLRGVYWHQMPGYDQKNFFSFKRSLPSFFWDNKTKLNCLAQSLKQSHDLAYAHHIQRLMIIGNFSVLAELNPQEVDYWFSIAYADAYGWVHTPNVIGMALYADGGVFATKPYISSGAYIQKMSNYCDHCQFNVKEKTGPKACPFNYLYWNFLNENQDKLRSNHRMRMIYSTLDKMKPERLEQIKKDSQDFLKGLSKADEKR